MLAWSYASVPLTRLPALAKGLRSCLLMEKR
jgi:hypothetical protein